MRRRILFVSSNYSSFVKQDAEALGEHYELVRFEFGSRKGLSMLIQQIKLLIWLISKLPFSQGIFIWFADYHSLLPVWLAWVFGRPSYLVIGGYDAARLPEYNYGGHNKPLRSWFIRMSCRAAKVILHVSAFVKAELQRQVGDVILSKSHIAHNGVDVSIFQCKQDWDSRKGVICVSYADNHNRAKIKGLDRYLELCKGMPEVPFTLVGVTGEYLKTLQESQPENLRLISAVPRQELEDLYNQAKVVCLLSRFESFGMSLAEGMLCGCVPVTMAGIGAAEIVDSNCGFVVSSPNQAEVLNSMESALASNKEVSLAARQRILEHFSLQKRWNRLTEVLEVHPK